MTPLHHSIMQVLMPLCLKENESHTGGTAKDNTSPEAKAVIAIAKKHTGINASYLEAMLEMLGPILKDDKLAQKFKATDKPVLSPFSVVKYKDKFLFIITHGVNLTALRPSGELKNLSAPTAVQLASPEEVEQCLEELTEAQLRTIMSNPIFGAVVTPLFQQHTELVQEEKKPAKTKAASKT